MTMMETCCDDLLDQAVQGMTSGQRRRFNRRCRWVPGYREAYVRELSDNLMDDPRFIEAAPMAVAMMASDDFTGQTKFQIDGSNLRVILDIIIEYGPKLLEVILLFVKAFTISIAFLCLVPAAAYGAYPVPIETAYPMPSQTAGMVAEVEQETTLPRDVLAQWGKTVGNCPGGVCPLPAPSGSMSRVRYNVPVRVEQVAPPQVSSGYHRQWYNHDGLTLRQHAEVMHGHSTAGLSTAQVAALNDRDHNSWGHGGHPHATTTHTHTQVRTGYQYPVARAAAVVSGSVVRGGVRVVTAPVRFVRRVQPVRIVGRGMVRAVAAIRPRNIVGRIRARRAARRCW